MSHYHPISSYPPAAAPDQLANAVLNALARPIGAKQSWGVGKMLILGILTLGLGPVLILSFRLREFIVGEQQQLLHLANWMRLANDHPQCVAFEAETARIRPRWWPGLLVLLIVFATAGGMYSVLNAARPFGEALLAGTYGFERTRIFDHFVWHYRDASVVFGMWVAGLSAAYAIQWLDVQMHAQDIRRVLWRFNQAAPTLGANGVSGAPLGIPLRPLWIGGAVCMILAHAPWGVIAMLAGAAQRRYINGTSRDFRAELAQRLRTMMQARQPQTFVPLPVYLRQRCVEPKCRAELPPGVNYCRRCGTRQR